MKVLAKIEMENSYSRLSPFISHCKWSIQKKCEKYQEILIPRDLSKDLAYFFYLQSYWAQCYHSFMYVIFVIL
jgi:hypothetical protein